MLTRVLHSQGYSLYVDGHLNATLQSPQAFWHIDGGDPVATSSPVFLCGRADHSAPRAFNGKVASFSIFDQPLSSAQVQSIWQSASSRSAEGDSILSPAAAPGPQPAAAVSSLPPQQSPASSPSPTQSGTTPA